LTFSRGNAFFSHFSNVKRKSRSQGSKLEREKGSISGFWNARNVVELLIYSMKMMNAIRSIIDH